jgi:uncharacterized protein involved in exopolysaccharide biosynthesis
MTEQNAHISGAGTELDEALFPGAGNADLEVSVIDILTRIAERKWLVAKVTAIAMAAGVILSFLLPVRYTAVTKLMPPQQTQSTAMLMMSQLMGGGAGSLAAMAGGGLGLKNPNDIYIGLLKSRPVADAMIHNFGLMDVYRSRDMTAARKKLADSTEITSEKSGFLSVSVTDKDKKRAAEMANAYTGQLRILTKTVAVTESSQRRLFYEDQLQQAKESLVQAEVSFQQVQLNKGLVAPNAQAAMMIESLATLRAQVAAKQVELASLLSYSTDRNPEVQLARQELSSLQAEAAGMEQRDHSAGFAHLGLEDVPSAGLDYLRAEREVKYREALFEMLIKQYEAAKLDEAKDATVIQVVEAAIEPDRKSSPKRALIVLLFTFVGFFGGCFLAEFLWRSEHARSDHDAVAQLQDLFGALRGRRKANA